MPSSNRMDRVLWFAMWFVIISTFAAVFGQ